MKEEGSISRTNPSKSRIRAFHIITTILVMGMLGGGISTLLRIDYQVNLFIHLGYPLFLMSMIGVGKIIAAIVLILPRFPLLKIGAYVGTLIVSICAVISHIVANDSALEIINPLTLMAMVLAAYFLNPYIKVISVNRV